MPISIHDIAKRLGVDSKQVLAAAQTLGIADPQMPFKLVDESHLAELEAALKTSMSSGSRCSLRGFQLGNFKAFSGTQRLPIKPLTLIFGANSSGKSSLIHGLLLARHAFETGDLNASRTTTGGDSVDLGGFGCYVHRRNLENRVELGFDLHHLDRSKCPDWLAPFASRLNVGSVAQFVGEKTEDHGTFAAERRELGLESRRSAPFISRA